MNVFRDIWGWIRAIFVSKPDTRRRADGEAFIPIDVDAAREELRLKDRAKRFGENELPASDDTSPDSTQKAVLNYVGERVNDSFRNANVELERLKGAIEDHDITELVRELRGLRAAEEAELARVTRQIQEEIDELEVQKRREEAKIEDFKEHYGITRDPDLMQQHEGRLLIAGLIALGLVQAFGNTLFFASGMRLGLSAGLLAAVVIGVADIGLHWTLGLTARGIRSPRFFDYGRGAVATLIAIVSVPLWNLSVVHLRNAVRMYGQADGFSRWTESLRSAPFGFTDFWSWVLLVVGMLLSGLAVAGASRWDDPIPVFRKAGTKLREIRADLSEEREELSHVGLEIRNETETRRANLVDGIRARLQTISSMRDRMKRLRENLLVYLDDADSAYSTLITEYRDENRIARGTPPPPYFDEPVQLDHPPPLPLDIAALDEWVQRQRSIGSEILAAADANELGGTDV